MLSLPLVLAVCSAGLVGGVHCLGMCGSLNWLLQSQLRRTSPQTLQFVDKQSWRAPTLTEVPDLARNAVDLRALCLLHAGRISCYMLMGAGFGSLGALSLSWQTTLPIAKIWYVVGNFSLLLVAINLSGWRLPGRFLKLLTHFASKIGLAQRFQYLSQHARRWPYLSGMLWGLLPCGLLYTVAPFAIFSGAAWSGAILMLLFAICALPHLIAAPLLRRWAERWLFLRYSLASGLFILGLLGLYFYDMKAMPDFLCVTPM